MGEITVSIADYMKRRTASVALRSLLAFFALWHWQVFYVTFFVDQRQIFEKFGLLRNEYLSFYFIGKEHAIFHAMGFGFAVVMTFIFCILLPKFVLRYAYKYEQKHKNDRRLIRLEEEANIKTREKDLLAKILEVHRKENEIAEKEQKIWKGQALEWEKEYSDFMKRKGAAIAIKEVVDCVYANSGRIVAFTNSGQRKAVGPISLKLADTYRLIQIDDEQGKISLTDKGVFFAKLFDY